MAIYGQVKCPREVPEGLIAGHYCPSYKHSHLQALIQYYQRLLSEDGYMTAEKVRDAYLGKDEKALKKKEEGRRNNTTLLDFFDRFNREYRLKAEAGTAT
ncbi:hypothetical protein CE91St19_00130 [Odoribacter laneus]|jgi:hypothetical protein|uniref:hypothetical protein n=1 Tax=Odoribacter laneus TaxID=626933 RepID=UPI001898F7BE|nr:hypothetical protein [Odoribacter laneus]GKI20611.1 hypothetical protein CE91St19_00130 [Odoribacter laneus]GKI23876.1 hypothetical protein CE91St20_00130 [Odoribacter laneus]